MTNKSQLLNLKNSKCASFSLWNFEFSKLEFICVLHFKYCDLNIKVSKN